MIQNPDQWREWEEAYIASIPPDHAQALRLAEEMLEHARRIGVYPPADPTEGIEDTIDLAMALNVPINPPATR